jgi:hypothetical protein
MAPGWIHETMDLIVFDRIYRHVHQKKDAGSQRTPGLRHREVGHKFYFRFPKYWNFTNPFPEWLNKIIRRWKKTKGADAAEEQMASDAHDYIDSVWDNLQKVERNYSEGFFVGLLYNPKILETWAGVDVLNGRILRTIEDQKVWEDSPETIYHYKRLRRDVSRHQISRLRDVIDRYSYRD